MTVDEIAEKFGIPSKDLSAALEVAKGAHDGRIDESLELQRDEIQDFRAASDAMRSGLEDALAAWRKMDNKDWMASDAYNSGSNLAVGLDLVDGVGVPVESIENKIDTALVDLHEVSSHSAASTYVSDESGAPRKLDALEEFARVVKEYWTTASGKKFAKTFVNGEPKSEGARFFWRCIQWLDRGYDLSNCYGVMKRVNKGDRPSRPKPEEEPKSESPDYAKITDDWLLGRK